MKKLLLQTPQYQYLEIGFKEHLDILGFSAMSVYNLPHIIREFLYFLEQKNITQITNLKQIHIKEYYEHINKRSKHTSHHHTRSLRRPETTGGECVVELRFPSYQQQRWYELPFFGRCKQEIASSFGFWIGGVV